jgi:hypothetical protein
MSLYLDWKQRPLEVQRKIDDSFSHVAIDDRSGWGIYNGVDDYHLCGIKEYALMKQIILDAPTRREFYALDIGAGNFQWGIGLGKYLEDQKELPKNIKIHIISIRGERNLSEREISTDLYTLYHLGAFKVEELFQQLSYLNLENKIDLVVSRWCFRHLVDPLGTFVQAFNLLRPKTGFFLYDGFFFFHQGQQIDGNNGNNNMDQLALDTHALFLHKFFSARQSLDHYLLQRKDETVPSNLFKSIYR